MNAGTSLKIEEISIDADIQPRVGGLDADHVRALEETPEAWPPVVAVLRDGAYVLVDGFHRFAAAQNLELEAVPVRVIDLPVDGDLHSLAFALNAEHGRPLSLTDRRAFAERLLRAHPEVSNMEVSRRAGLSPTTVAGIRDALEARAMIEPAPRRIGADGSVYTVGSDGSKRAAGELPAPGIGAMVSDVVGRVFTSTERRQQRRIAQYLTRLAIALADQYELDGWETPDSAADACRMVLGEEAATELGSRLGPACRNVLHLAMALGFKDGESGA